MLFFLTAYPKFRHFIFGQFLDINNLDLFGQKKF
jgi:hypothetical protein